MMSRPLMRDRENAGTPLEPILPSSYRKMSVAALKASGMVKMYRIGQSAGRV